MIKAVIIGHANYAQALLDAAEKIVGKQEGVEVISNAGLSGDALCNKILEACNKDRKEKVIFVDLPGGSCTISCLNIMKKKRNLNIICGMNLPMLLEFFLLREKYPSDKLIPILIKKARDSIFKVGNLDG